MNKILLAVLVLTIVFLGRQQVKISRLEQDNARLAHNVEVLEEVKTKQAIHTMEVKNYTATLEKQLKEANETINLLLEDIYTSGQMPASKNGAEGIKPPHTAKKATRDKLYELYNSPF